MALTDLENVSCEVGSKVSDHKLVAAVLKFSVPKVETATRTVWDLNKANWEQLKERLRGTDWNFLDTLGPDAGTEKLTRTLLEVLRESVPERVVIEKKTTHPWLTERTLALVAAKHAAEGTLKKEKQWKPVALVCF